MWEEADPLSQCLRLDHFQQLGPKHRQIRLCHPVPLHPSLPALSRDPSHEILLLEQVHAILMLGVVEEVLLDHQG